MDTFDIDLGQVTQEFLIPEYHDRTEVCHLGVFTVDTPLIAGAASISVDPGIDRYIPVAELQNINLVDLLEVRFSYPIKRLRITLVGVSGGAGVQFHLFHSSEWFADGFPKNAFRGDRALTSQSYIEINCKRGVQFESSSLVPALAAGGVINAILKTGSKPVLLKNRQVAFTGRGITAQVFLAPTYTGGTPVPVFNLKIGGSASTVEVLAGATVSNTGTEVAAPTYAVGSSNAGSSATSGTFSGFGYTGLERVIPANTTLLLRITNRDLVNPTDVSTYATWFEGTPDVV